MLQAVVGSSAFNLDSGNDYKAECIDPPVRQGALGRGSAKCRLLGPLNCWSSRRLQAELKHGKPATAEAQVQGRSHAINVQTLHRLQDIYDAAWDELLHQKSRHTFPWRAESARFLLARVVLEYAADYREQSVIVAEVIEKIECAEG